MTEDGPSGGRVEEAHRTAEMIDTIRFAEPAEAECFGGGVVIELQTEVLITLRGEGNEQLIGGCVGKAFADHDTGRNLNGDGRSDGEHLRSVKVSLSG